MILDIALSISNNSRGVRSDIYANEVAIRDDKVKEVTLNYTNYEGLSHLFAVSESDMNYYSNGEGVIKRLASFQNIQMSEEESVDYKVSSLTNSLKELGMNTNEFEGVQFKVLMFENNKLGIVSEGTSVSAYRFRDGLITELRETLSTDNSDLDNFSENDELIDKIYKSKIEDKEEVELNMYDVKKGDIYILCNEEGNRAISERVKFILEEENDIAYIMKALKELSASVNETTFTVVKVVEVDEIVIEEKPVIPLATDNSNDDLILNNEYTNVDAGEELEPELINILDNSSEKAKETLEDKLNSYDKPKKFDLLKTLIWVLFFIAIVLVVWLFVFQPYGNEGEVDRTPRVADSQDTSETTPKPTKKPKATPTPTAAPGSVHTVVSGDTLWSISEKYYGSGQHEEEIAKANNTTVDAILNIGDKLTIPVLDQ